MIREREEKWRGSNSFAPANRPRRLVTSHLCWTLPPLKVCWKMFDDRILYLVFLFLSWAAGFPADFLFSIFLFKWNRSQRASTVRRKVAWRRKRENCRKCSPDRGRRVPNLLQLLAETTAGWRKGTRNSAISRRRSRPDCRPCCILLFLLLALLHPSSPWQMEPPPPPPPLLPRRRIHRLYRGHQWRTVGRLKEIHSRGNVTWKDDMTCRPSWNEISVIFCVFRGGQTTTTNDSSDFPYAPCKTGTRPQRHGEKPKRK